MEWFTVGFWGTAGVLGFIVAAILAVITLWSVAGLLWAIYKRIELHNDRVAYRWDATARVVEERWLESDRARARMVSEARWAREAPARRLLEKRSQEILAFEALALTWQKPGHRYEFEHDLARDRILWAMDGKIMDPQPEGYDRWSHRRRGLQ